MNNKIGFFAGIVAIVFAISGCDLQPKIVSLPDSVGDFISTRYPALLADPDTEAEIYNSAATDYGMYASPELYGTDSTYNDYVLYASINDYIIPPQSYDMSMVYGAGIQNKIQMTPVKTDETKSEMTPVVISETIAPDAVDIAKIPENDYLMIPNKHVHVDTDIPTTVTVVRGDTMYSLARKYDMKTAQLAEINNIKAPYALRVGQVLKLKPDMVKSDTVNAISAQQQNLQNVKQKMVEPKVEQPTIKQEKQPLVQTTTRVNLREITVAPGDTLYSVSRKYSVPVNDLAVMNKLSQPFTLSVGQKLKVPDLQSAPVVGGQDIQKKQEEISKKTEKTSPVAVQPVTKKDVKTQTKNNAKTQTTQKNVGIKAESKAETKKTDVKNASVTKTEQKKISSNPNTKLPQITARSSSKFSWPVRGTILSNYGAKSGGLFNDGINIGANRGTIVRAAENGVVAYAGNEVKGMGNLIIIQHAGGWMTVYAHMDSMYVRRGSRVSVGGQIGTVGQTGKVEKPQLHFEIRKGTKAYNPTAYLKK